MSAGDSIAVVDRVHKWLGDVPTGWAGARLLEVADAWTSNVDKHTVEGQPSVRLCNYVDVYKNDAITDSLDFMSASATREQIQKFRIRRGDTLITKDSETADDIGVPAFVEYEADDLICGYHLAIVRPDTRRVVPKFLHWALDSEPTARQWGVTAAGVTRVGIRSTDLNKVTIPLPSLDEQRAIADYLDQETAQIDALVAKQEEFIGLLRERRVGLIATGVTGGRRGSDVDDHAHYWLGSLPVGWKVVPAKAAFTERRQRSRPGDVHLTPSQKYGVLPQADYMRITGTKVVLNLAGQDDMRHVEADDFVIHLRSFQGGIEWSRNSGKVSMAYTVLTPRKGTVAPGYFRWVLKSDAYIQELRSTTDQLRDGQSIKYSTFAKIPLPLPPVDEQRRIASELDEQTSRIDNLIDKAEEHIALAKERRAALITAAVTGQFDVRTARKAG